MAASDASLQWALLRRATPDIPRPHAARLSSERDAPGGRRRTARRRARRGDPLPAGAGRRPGSTTSTPPPTSTTPKPARRFASHRPGKAPVRDIGRRPPPPRLPRSRLRARTAGASPGSALPNPCCDRSASGLVAVAIGARRQARRPGAGRLGLADETKGEPGERRRAWWRARRQQRRIRPAQQRQHPPPRLHRPAKLDDLKRQQRQRMSI
jgi:hypothetical protein